MKIPVGKTIEDAPYWVKVVIIASAGKIPIGLSTLDKAIEEGPEWFPEEVEYRRKISLVPQEVHDAHIEESMELETEWSKQIQPSKGIVYWSSHPEEAAEWNRIYKETAEKYNIEGRRTELWNKHYGPYGLQK
jgi:hypothetical protein